jgi:uncharacterized Fe-S center protein
MAKSDVYFTDFKATFQENLLQKLKRLLVKSGLEKIDMDKKFVALKIHFGEPGNLAYLRANYAKVVVDWVKAHGGKPFVTDCNTLYPGGRKNALDHLDSAYENGYNPFTLGCHVLIGDGLKGTDEAEVPVPGEYVQMARIGQAVMDADILISLTHFKAHEMTGIGGALKNIGMGAGSRAGKMDMHSSSKPSVNEADCVQCEFCAKQCAHSAISFPEGKARIDHDKCVGCGRCIGVCSVDAVKASWSSTTEEVNRKISEYALAVLQGRPHFHIALICDVSPFCDCHMENDRAIIPDVGILASFDPVALDQAATDLACAQPILTDSLLGDRGLKPGDDYFTALHPTTDWRTGIDQAVKIGLGQAEYNLLKMV